MIKKIAKPKVNLCLHVTGKRDDGYHLLESLVVFPDGGDEIIVRQGKDLSLSVSGPFSDDIGDISDNLVLKAARLLQQHTGCRQGAEIELVKNLPVASGIGGGSADAAAALLLLAKLWKCSLGPEELQDIGLSLGADVPACLIEKPLIMAGIGEDISEIDPFPGFYILLINSKTKVSTPEVFKNLNIPVDRPNIEPFDLTTTGPLFSLLNSCRNDLQPAAIKIAPDISKVLCVLEAQSGCKLARMSGSGATCFGLFELKVTADTAASKIAQEYPDWWVKVMPV
ncbi:4-(cytidine 5'-diphospho)-2-C-methyl-D-erythritol kinase [Sneathiella marina]|uniref:4-diphosphocytidyl-2-C-methyl-D-erythritol kinase n=1 Tax=Sneathiella marina TaxID=2950108 RepID=A0ABY4W5V7_9PROT|nr:4-(cytidine 5'-diphospho)-2-C-methyl-D-erythritol kinase [Sneathiella marina]USG62204.1 4-(cytidine 5'-diphospho)-2-C-methyl-D-erythritol kinase [Sneathiella marina]